MGTATPEIIQLEGQRNRAYRDIVNVLTVCAGHTGPDIVVDKVYSNEECKKITARDVEKAAVGVLKVSPHLIWHPMQLAATISFTFNIGVGAYSTSSVARLFNVGDFYGACNYMAKYKYAGGKESQGLINRRAREVEICLSTLTADGMKNVVT